MDNLCHTLAGAAMGRAGLARRTPFAMGVLMIAANLPDVDVAVFLTDTLPVSFRRGWTHGVVAQLLLPVLLTLATGWWARRRGQPMAWRDWLLLSVAGVYSHVGLDYLNSYGVRLLMPFSSRWFYGDALYIVDPWMYLLLGGGLWWSFRRERAGHARAARPVQAGLALAVVYCLAMWGSNLWARQDVLRGLVRAGLPESTTFMVTPVLVNPFRREVVITQGGRYEKGVVQFGPQPRFRPAGFGVDTGLTRPDAAAVLATPTARAFLSWSRFPFVVPDPEAPGQRFFLNDYRYSDSGGRVGWAGMQVTVDAPTP
ncbi:MAG: metal-dependent hydrolase [Acidobacteria bacterium]|nr:metal-dependent hydrolase [Acidobacteriota bacterium]